VNDSTPVEKFGWTFRYRLAKKKPSRVLLLLHGWTGDERSMWQFTRNLPMDYLIIAPRAPYPALADKGGYSWREIKPGTWGSPTLAELEFSADKLLSLVDALARNDAGFGLDSDKRAFVGFDTIGFSQGGALALTLAVLYPKRVNNIGVLSGFVPPGVDALLRPALLDGMRFFWAHGTKDEMIPFQRGVDAIKILKNAGADIHLCQAEIGHKVSKNCRDALKDFLREK